MVEAEFIKVLWPGCFSYGKECLGQRTFMNSASTMIFSPDIVRNCCHHLAIFFRSLQDEPAQWLTIVSTDNDMLV